MDFAYLTNIQLKELQKDIGNDIINLSGEKNIISITVSSPSSSSGISSKLIIVIGLFLGLCAGMFFAIIKAPLKNIFKELNKIKIGKSDKIQNTDFLIILISAFFLKI